MDPSRLLSDEIANLPPREMLKPRVFPFRENPGSEPVFVVFPSFLARRPNDVSVRVQARPDVREPLAREIGKRPIRPVALPRLFGRRILAKRGFRELVPRCFTRNRKIDPINAADRLAPPYAAANLIRDAVGFPAARAHANPKTRTVFVVMV